MRATRVLLEREQDLDLLADLLGRSWIVWWKSGLGQGRGRDWQEQGC